MHHAFLFVQVFERLGDLNDDVSTEILAEIGQADDLVEEFAARTQLEHDEVVLTRFGERNQLDDVGMIDLTHDLNLFEDVCSLSSSVRNIGMTVRCSRDVTEAMKVARTSTPLGCFLKSACKCLSPYQGWLRRAMDIHDNKRNASYLTAVQFEFADDFDGDFIELAR